MSRFWGQTRVGPGNNVLDGGSDPPWEGQFWGDVPGTLGEWTRLVLVTSGHNQYHTRVSCITDTALFMTACSDIVCSDFYL